MKPFPWMTFAVAALNARGIFSLVDPHHHTTAIPLADGSFLKVDNELPGPTLIDGAPSKLYSISLGRTWHNISASVEVSAAIEEKKLMRRNWQGRRSLKAQAYLDFEDTPLFPGWGTHFAYVYVGTPPQRVSVIIDTGSHFTAFPCAECRNCGSHTDPHWDHHKSSTSEIVSCENCHGSFRCQKNKRCGFSQRYSEGSSWSAYQVQDVLWVGELTLEESAKLRHDESAYAVDFMFGCIESQTGLFKTQLADGIMGMSADSHTLVWQLSKAKKIKDRIFSLCFGMNGGTMVIGGYDTRLNKPGAEMVYSALTKTSGWFTIKVLDITLNGVSIEADASVYQRGKGIIVDSGTTDTYLPKSVAKGFSKAWEATTGSPYKTCVDNHFCMTLTPAELEALPTVTVHIDGGVEVHVRPEAYLDALGKNNAYAPRIYLTESMGGVLGANVMRDHNVVFDHENHRIGFAEGVCEYKAEALDKDVVRNTAQKDKPDLTVGTGDAAGAADRTQEGVDCVTAKEQVKACDAQCPSDLETPVTSKGYETWVEVIMTRAKEGGKACPELLEDELRECVKECPVESPEKSKESVPGSNQKGDKEEDDDLGGLQGVDVLEDVSETFCSIEQELWTACSADCLQERYLDAACKKEAEVRVCHVGDSCYTSKSGLLISMDLSMTLVIGDERVERDPDPEDLWMAWLSNAVADTLAALLKDIRAGNVEVTINASDPYVKDITTLSPGTNVVCIAHVEMHLTPKVDNVAANRVSQVVNRTSFVETLTFALEGATHGHWLLSGVIVAVTAAENVSIFLASNGEPYYVPESNRLQSAKPQSGRLPKGTGMLLAGVMVVTAMGAVIFRIRQLEVEEKKSKVGSELELLTLEPRFDNVDDVGVLGAARRDKYFRRSVSVARGDT